MEREPSPGVVKWFNAAKGYGMVTAQPDDGGGDYFVHHSAIKMDDYRSLYEGESVSFLPCVGTKGRYAEDVTPTGRTV